MSSRYIPPCSQSPDLFFPPVEDGREEVGRRQREVACKAQCYRCEIRVSCLHIAIRTNSTIGVWGGMGEGERRRFIRWLRVEYGLEEPPSEVFLRKLVREFYELKWSEEEAM